MFCEISFNLASVDSFFQQKREMEQCMLFPVHSDIWWSSDLRVLPFQSGKISQIKIGNSRDSWILCHTFSVLCFPASPSLPKYQKSLCRQRQEGTLLWSWRMLRFCSCPTAAPPVGSVLVLPAWAIPGATQTHPALPGFGSWGFVPAIKHRN